MQGTYSPLRVDPTQTVPLLVPSPSGSTRSSVPVRPPGLPPSRDPTLCNSPRQRKPCLRYGARRCFGKPHERARHGREPVPRSAPFHFLKSVALVRRETKVRPTRQVSPFGAGHAWSSAVPAYTNYLTSSCPACGIRLAPPPALVYPSHRRPPSPRLPSPTAPERLRSNPCSPRPSGSSKPEDLAHGYPSPPTALLRKSSRESPDSPVVPTRGASRDRTLPGGICTVQIP